MSSKSQWLVGGFAVGAVAGWIFSRLYSGATKLVKDIAPVVISPSVSAASLLDFMLICGKLKVKFMNLCKFS